MELAPRKSRSVEHRRKPSGFVAWLFRSMVSILRRWWWAGELTSKANDGDLLTHACIGLDGCSLQKLKMTKVTQSHREQGLQMSSANSTVIYLHTMELKKSHKTLWIMKKEQTTMRKQRRRKNEETLMIIDEEIQTTINKLKKGKASDNNGIRAKDIKICDDATKEIIKPLFNEVLFFKQFRNMAHNIDKSVIQNERRICRKLKPDLHSANAVQIVVDHLVQEIWSSTWPSSTWRSRKVPSLLPKAGSLSDIQDDWTEMPRVVVDMWNATIDFMKAFHSIDHNSTWKAHNSCGIEQECISLLKKTLQIPTSNNNDWQRATCSRSKGGPSKVNCCPVCSSTMYCRWLSKTTFHAGKRKKIGHMLGRLRARLLHKLTICWRRALVCVFVRKATIWCVKPNKEKWNSNSPFFFDRPVWLTTKTLGLLFLACLSWQIQALVVP